jgi:hypothetical protein
VAAAEGPPRPAALWHILTGIWALLALPVCASLAPDLLLGMLAFFVGGLLGLAWVIQVLRVISDRDARRRMTGRAALGWAAYPATALLLYVLLTTGVLVHLRVRLSEPALQRLAEEVAAGAKVDDRWVGLMWIEGAWVSGNAVLLSVGASFMETTGLAYSLDGLPAAPEGHPLTHHLHGRWYTFYYWD